MEIIQPKNSRLERVPQEAVDRAARDLPKKPFEAWASKKYLVQLYRENNPSYPGLVRMTVSRTQFTQKGQRIEWRDGMDWSELQNIKKYIGYGEWYGLEVYPKESDTINVANMRHVWLLETPLSIGWFNPTTE